MTKPDHVTSPGTPPVFYMGTSMCKRLGQWRGCRFEARYDLEPAQVKFDRLQGEGAGSFLDKFRKQTYVRDVCTRCGATVERSHAE